MVQTELKLKAKRLPSISCLLSPFEHEKMTCIKEVGDYHNMKWWNVNWSSPVKLHVTTTELSVPQPLILDSDAWTSHTGQLCTKNHICFHHNRTCIPLIPITHQYVLTCNCILLAEKKLNLHGKTTTSTWIFC